MKKCFLYCGVMLYFLLSICLAAEFTIVKSPQAVKVNGTQTEFEVYNINGNNFFKLRDIAYVLNGTHSQFSVSYNEENQMIEIETGKAYIPNGNEMKLGVDNSGSAVKSSQKLMINGVETELLAYNIAGNNFFQLRELGAKVSFQVDYSEQENTVLVESNKLVTIQEVLIQKINGVPYLQLKSDGPIEKYTAFDLFGEENKRIVVDISNSEIAVDSKVFTAKEGNILQVRIGDQGNHVNRFVLDLEKSAEYQVFQGQNALYIVLSKQIDPNLLLGSSSVITEPIEEKPSYVSGDVVALPQESGEDSGENIIIINNPAYSEEELNQRIKISSVKYSSSTNKVKITGEKNFTYHITTLENPDRIIVDMENTVLDVEGQTSIQPINKAISEIRFSQYEEMLVRLVIEGKAKLNYQDKIKSGVLEITIEEPTYQNLTYTTDASQAIITLHDVSKEVFTVVEDTKNFKYTIKYSESRFSCGKETLTIDDSWVDTIKISTGKIVVQGKDNMKFSMEENRNDVIVTITQSSTVNPVITNTVNRTSRFTVYKISDERYLVGKVYINNKSGLALDTNELAKKSNLGMERFLIYHTHTSEAYIESGSESNYHSNDSSINIVSVGKALTNYLTKKGFTVTHNTTKNDGTYNDAYDYSFITVQNALKKNSYDVLIDIHRDAVSSNLSYGPTTTIKGEKVAKMMLVMGTDATLENPNWMENLKTALLIQNKAEEMYPGLFRDLSLVKYRYNQHLSPGAILIEVGATGNTLEEVQNAMKYLANVFAALDE